jgi:hypothetical protein
MSNVKTENLKNGYKRETKTYDNGSSKSVTFKPTWIGRDIKSVERRSAPKSK